MVYEDSNSISEPGIDKLVIDIFDFATKNNTINNDISTLIAGTKDYYDSADGEIFRNRFNNLLSNSQQLNTNILSFASDLVKIKGRYGQTKAQTVEYLTESRVKHKEKDRRV